MTRYFSLLETKLHRWVPVLLILGGVLGNVFTAEAGITDTTGITDTSNRNPESVDVPITLSDDRMIVSLEIEGMAGKQYFILDTAAGGFVFSPRLRKQLAIDPARVHRDTVKGASGQRLMKKVILQEVRFGNRSFSEISAVVFSTNTFREYDGKQAEGILGVNVLRHFDLSFDLSHRVLQLYRNRTLNQRANRVSIPFQSNTQPGFVEFQIHINGEPVLAVLHSGARRNILNWKAANALGITSEDPDVQQHLKNSKGIEGVGGVATFDYTFDLIQLGTANLENSATNIVDDPVFDVLGTSEGPAILIGLEMFKHCRVEINYSTNRLAFIQ